MSPQPTLIRIVEGQPFAIESLQREELERFFIRLQNELRFRSFPLSYSRGSKATIRGIIGILSIRPNLTIEVIPKTEPSDDWIPALLSLLVGADRVEATFGRKGGLARERRSILSVIAQLYSTVLSRALNRDGPVLLLQRRRFTRAAFRGKLAVSEWLRAAGSRPHMFPTESNHLTAENDFNAGMATVAGLLANHAGTIAVKAALLTAQRALRSGLPLHSPVPASVTRQSLPPQWSNFKPAWTIVNAVLTRRSPLGAHGASDALTIAIEPWPLLERLLLRSLMRAARLLSTETGRVFVAHGKSRRRLLTDQSKKVVRTVEPDAWLEVDGIVCATFDAKYKLRENGDWPAREDVFQVVATAATFHSPLAVLVYPEHFDAESLGVHEFRGHPDSVVMIGLGLYSYQPGAGDIERARRLAEIMHVVVPKVLLAQS